MNESEQGIFFTLEPQQILTAENFLSLKNQAYSYMDSLDWDRALDFANKLEVKFQKFNPANRDEAYWYSIVRFWILRLKLFAYTNLTREEKQNLIKDHALEIVKNEIDIRNYIFRYIDTFNTPDIIEPEVKDISAALRNNLETLGENNQPSFSPSMKNWILQYQLAVNKPKSGPFNAGALEATEFVNSNQYARVLSAENRRYLKSILDFYNWLQNPIAYVEEKAPLPQVIQATTISQRVAPTPPLPRPVPPVLAPVIKTNPAKISFEDKLAQASAAHGTDLESLKHKLEENKISFEPEPKPAPASPIVPKVSLTPREIKREVGMTELPAHKTSPVSSISSLRPVIPKAPVPPVRIVPPAPVRAPIPVPTPSIPAPRRESVNLSLRTLNDIKVVEDLKRIEVEHLRQASANVQTKLIKSKILNLAQANNLLPYYAVIAFEASPLFQEYLKLGNAKIVDNKAAGNLTQDEFEAVADLRKEIERL